MPLGAASCQEMAEMEIGEGLPGASVSCRNGEREWAAVKCQKLPENGGNGGIGFGHMKLPLGAKKERK